MEASRKTQQNSWTFKMFHCLTVVSFPQACVLATPGWGLKSLLRRPTCGASAPWSLDAMQWLLGSSQRIKSWKHMKTIWTSGLSVRPSDSQHQCSNGMQSSLVKPAFNEVHLKVVLPRGLAGIGSIYQDCLFWLEESEERFWKISKHTII